MDSSDEWAAVNQTCDNRIAKIRPEGDFANSNRSHYLKGQSKETD